MLARRLAAGVLIAALIGSQGAQAAQACQGERGYAASFGGRRTFLWRPQALSSAKAAIGRDANAVPAYGPLIRAADKAMTDGPWSVTDKTRTPPSGDRHDYMSIAPYFWPDPAKADRLP